MTDDFNFGAKFEGMQQEPKSPFFERAGQTLFTRGEFVSSNFKSGESGWMIDELGNAEFNAGTFRGALSASTIDIGGSDATSFHVDIDGNLWSGSATFAGAPFSVSNAGALIATNATITGSITATSGAIGGFDIGSDYIRDVANSFGLASTVTGSDDIRFWAGDTYANRATAPFRVTEAGAITASNFTMTGGALSGIVNSTATDISLLEKTHNLTFSVTDADTIAWTSGTIVYSNGRTFTIDAGNTGNMLALTYIYLDTGVSSTVLQTTTTYSTAMGANKSLFGMAQNNTVTAMFIPYGAGTPLIDGANIGALSIVAGNIAASTITAGKLSVSQLSAITADLGTITAGTVTGATIQTSASGRRVLIDSTGITLYNSSDVAVGWLNSNVSESVNGLALISGTDQTLMYADNSSTGALTKETMIIVNRGTGKAAAFFKNYNVASAADTVSIEQAGTGNGLGVNVTLSTNSVYAGDFRNAGTGGGLYVFGNNASRALAHIVIDRSTANNGTHGDIAFPNRSADPSAGTVGEICVVNATLKICTAATPTWSSLLLGTGTANEITYWTATGTLGTLAVATYPSLTELSYVKGLTSSAQTQITAITSVFKNGSTTYTADHASSTQDIAHGLGVTPKKIRITVRSIQNGSIPYIVGSDGTYNGTTISNVSWGRDSSAAFASGDSTYVSAMYFTDTAHQRATVTVDATNISLGWVRTGSTQAVTMYIMWEAEI